MIAHDPPHLRAGTATRLSTDNGQGDRCLLLRGRPGSNWSTAVVTGRSDAYNREDR
jgi:hypothetical protein